MDACADERLHMYHTDARLSSYLSPNPGIYSPSTPGKDPLKWGKTQVLPVLPHMAPLLVSKQADHRWKIGNGIHTFNFGLILTTSHKLYFSEDFVSTFSCSFEIAPNRYTTYLSTFYSVKVVTLRQSCARKYLLQSKLEILEPISAHLIILGLIQNALLDMYKL